MSDSPMGDSPLIPPVDPDAPGLVFPVEPDPRAELAGALAEQHDRLLPCVHCGFCLPACPTYQRLGDENDSPRGRLYLMKAVIEGRLEPSSDAFQEHIDRCLGCRACEPVCPSGVEYGHLLEKARQVALEARPPSGLLKRLLRTFSSKKKTARAMWLGRFLRESGLAAVLEAVLPAGTMRSGLTMLLTSRPLPLKQIRGGPRDEEAEGQAVERTAPARDDGTALRVGILTGCVQDGLYRRVNEATERVLRANGFEVVTVPNQGCCGALHAHAGAHEDAVALGAANAEAFDAIDLDYVVVNAAGCGATMKDYGHLMEWGDHAEVGARIGARVRDLSEVLALAGPRRGAPLDVSITADSPCHLEHAQRLTDPSGGMLGAIPGLDVRPLSGSSECCGGAGIYGITHPELGGHIGRDKAEAVVATGAELVATPNPGCMMQIGAELRAVRSNIGVVHPVELLDESYRRAGLYGQR